MAFVYIQAELLSVDFADCSSDAASTMLHATIFYNLAQVRRQLCPDSTELRIVYLHALQAALVSTNSSTLPVTMGYETLSLSWIQQYTQAINNFITCQRIAIPALYHLGVREFRKQNYEAASYFKMLFDQTFVVFGANSFGVGVALQCFGLL
jgi:hypothetical protein